MAELSSKRYLPKGTTLVCSGFAVGACLLIAAPLDVPSRIPHEINWRELPKRLTETLGRRALAVASRNLSGWYTENRTGSIFSQPICERVFT